MVARAAACRLVGVFNGIHPLTVLLRKRLDRAATWYLARDDGEGNVPSLHANSTTAGVPAYGASARRRSHWLGVRLGLRVACVGGRGGLRGQDEAVLIGSRGNNHAERRSWNAIKTCAWVETRS